MLAEMSTDYRLGLSDCFTFIHGAVKAMTGVYLAPEMIGEYGSRRSAVNAMKRHGHVDVISFARAIAKRHDIEEIPPEISSVGDIVLARSVHLSHAFSIRWTTCLATKAPRVRGLATASDPITAWRV